MTVRVTEVPHTDLVVAFDSANDTVTISSRRNGSVVVMNHQEWSWLVECSRKIRGLAR